jgi:hypothetical protein
LTTIRTKWCPVCERSLSEGTKNKHLASCDECEKKISIESKFCRYCGSPVPKIIEASSLRWRKKYEHQNQFLPESIEPDMTKTMPCPHCADGWGYKMGSADQTCFECGQIIGKWEYKKDGYELHMEQIKKEYKDERIKYVLILIILIIIFIFLIRQLAKF